MGQQVDVGATVEEHADDLGAPRFGGHVQRCVAERRWRLPGLRADGTTVARMRLDGERLM